MTTERMTKFEFEEPDAKSFDSSEYEEVKPSVAQHADELFSTGGRKFSKPRDEATLQVDRERMEAIDAGYKRRHPNGRTRNGL